MYNFIWLSQIKHFREVKFYQNFYNIKILNVEVQNIFLCAQLKGKIIFQF